MRGEGVWGRASLVASAPVGPEGAWTGGMVPSGLRLSVVTPTLGAHAGPGCLLRGRWEPRGGSQSPCTDPGASEQREARLGEAAPEA